MVTRQLHMISIVFLPLSGSEIHPGLTVVHGDVPFTCASADRLREFIVENNERIDMAIFYTGEIAIRDEPSG
jgi:hypothetical protein